MLRIKVEGEHRYQSAELPVCVETRFAQLLKQDPPLHGLVTTEGLDRIEKSIVTSDSNECVIGEAGSGGTEIVVDGGEALKVVLQGLRRRLQHPLAESEKLRISGVPE